MNCINQVLNIKEILKILPHRYPFLLIDRVVQLQRFKYLKAVKNCTINEPYFQGHFLKQSVFPGVLIVEAMAQASGILIYKSTGELDINNLYYFIGIDDTRFKKNAIPGDQIFIEVTVLKYTKRILKFKSIAIVQNNIICKSTVIFAKK